MVKIFIFYLQTNEKRTLGTIEKCTLIKLFLIQYNNRYELLIFYYIFFTLIYLLIKYVFLYEKTDRFYPYLIR